METVPAQQLINEEEAKGSSMSRGDFFRTLLVMNGMKWLTVFGCALLAGILLAVFITWEIAILTLMVVLIVIPMTVMFLYFYHGLKSWTLLNTSPHLFEIKEQGLGVKLTATGRDVVLGYDDMICFSEFNKGMIYKSRSGEGWIWIGSEWFEDRQDFIEFINKLNESIAV